MPTDKTRQSFKQSGYKYIKYLGARRHLLHTTEPLYAGGFEVWQTNREAVGFGLTFKNTALQFERPTIERVVNFGTDQATGASLWTPTGV